MKKSLEIKDPALIREVLDEAEYGVLALYDDKPYSVPVNFVFLNDAIYIHSSPKGKKMRIINSNPQASFNIVSYSQLIPSYFTSDEGLACPATSFFKSITVDGMIEKVESLEEIKQAFTAMMEKLQPEGQYKSFDAPEYENEFKALEVLKIRIEELSAKFKFGQKLKWDRYQILLKQLKESGSEKDLKTLSWVEKLYSRKRPEK